jgi:hypothetical protein
VVTGFFGMNFGGWFEKTFFQPDKRALPVHWAAIIIVAIFALSTVGFGAYVVISNWQDYRESLLPNWWLARKARRGRSLRRSI